MHKGASPAGSAGPVAARRRGRPPKSDDPSTRDRLLDAAAAACATDGFEAVTVADIARGAGVTPTAIYNHFDSKEELLYVAGRRALDQLASTLAGDGAAISGVHDVAAAFLRPDMAATRRLLLELHMASVRHPELSDYMTQWHREFAGFFTGLTQGTTPERRATVKSLFLLLLGLCHLEQLDGVRADRARVVRQVGSMVETLYPAAAP